MGAESEPKGSKRDPKGCQGEPKGAEREPKVTKMDPRGCQKGAKLEPKCHPKSFFEKGRQKGGPPVISFPHTCTFYLGKTYKCESRVFYDFLHLFVESFSHLYVLPR